MATAAQRKALTKRWNAVKQGIPIGTGIFLDWVNDAINGKNHGPVMSLEYQSNDWSDNPIIVQEFMYGWCEWYNGVTHWYKGE